MENPGAIKTAAYAWRHFVELMAFPADQAAQLWQVVRAQANDGNQM
jgi:hypothetical protein